MADLQVNPAQGTGGVKRQKQFAPRMLNPLAESYLGAQQASAEGSEWHKKLGRYFADQCFCGDRTQVQIRRDRDSSWIGERRCRLCGLCFEIQCGGDYEANGLVMTMPPELENHRQRHRMAMDDWLRENPGKKIVFNPDGTLTPNIYDLQLPSWPAFFARRWWAKRPRR